MLNVKKFSCNDQYKEHFLIDQSASVKIWDKNKLQTDIQTLSDNDCKVASYDPPWFVIKHQLTENVFNDNVRIISNLDKYNDWNHIFTLQNWCDFLLLDDQNMCAALGVVDSDSHIYDMIIFYSQVLNNNIKYNFIHQAAKYQLQVRRIESIEIKPNSMTYCGFAARMCEVIQNVWQVRLWSDEAYYPSKFSDLVEKMNKTELQLQQQAKSGPQSISFWLNCLKSILKEMQ